jgi:AAA domain-containing protein
MYDTCNAKPITHQRNLAKLPKALAPLIERPQWCVWRWTQKPDSSWQKPPYMALQPERHASTDDPSTWADYATALATVQAKHADGLSYVLTKDDPFGAIDLDHCRCLVTHSIDVWAQNYLQAAVNTYQEVTPSGEGVRIWGIADGNPLNRKFTLKIEGKNIAAELFRKTNKALTITGYTLDPAIHELSNIDGVFDWALVWGERRKAAAEQATSNKGNGFDSSGCRYSIDDIEQIVREGPPAGANRSDVFHTIVGHYIGCGWDVDRIFEHLQEHPQGIGSRYLAEDRLRREIERSAEKFTKAELPLFETKAPPEQEPLKQEEPEPADPDLLDDDVDDDLDSEEDELDDEEQQDPNLPRLHAHGELDPRPLKAWLVKGLIPQVGHGLMSGQWGAGKTFTFFDLAAALNTGQPWLGHVVKRQSGVLLIAAEGADEVRLRLDAVVREKCGSMARAPFRWYETAPLLLHKGAVEKLIAMAWQAEASLQDEFGLPLGLIGIDTIAACAGYSRAGDEYDNAVGQAVMNVLRAVAQELKCFVLGIDHFGKNLEAGTRGASSKESSGDLVLACLGDKQLSGSVTNTRLAVRKHRGGRQGQEYPFSLRMVEAPDKDEDGDPIITMVVDWLPPGTTTAAPLLPDDPWIAGCRQEDQRAGMARLKRVLLAALAEHAVERPIPSPTHVPNSAPTREDELGTPVGDAPVVRMVSQEIVREAYYLCTPGDPRQTQYNRFTRARDRAEHLGLISVGNADGITYLWLTRPDPGNDEG